LDPEAGRAEAKVLLGPTASGKTAVSIPVARALGAAIVSVDSRQVYRGMAIGSAAPSPAERAQVPHHLVEIQDPRQPLSAGAYGRLARAVLDDLGRRGTPALLVGGSGLYLRAVLGGLDEGLPRDELLRERLRQRSETEGMASLHQELARIDPVTASRLSPADEQRITRALEIALLTGAPPSALRRKGRGSEVGVPIVVLDRDRADLESRIRSRVEAMIREGLEDEVRRLLEAGLEPRNPPLKSVGYAETVRLFRGELDRIGWEATIVANTRRYAKRQRTWFRALPGAVWIRIEPHEPPECTAVRVLDVWS
jgi:tRNA dimethylallyltransferase